MRFFIFSFFFLGSGLLLGQQPITDIVIGSTEAYKEDIQKNPNNSLVKLTDSDFGIKLDIRLATKNNITGDVIYPEAAAFVRQPLLNSLEIIHAVLKKRDLGLIIYDAYRPYSVAKAMANKQNKRERTASLETMLKHSRGASVDVSLYSLETGEEIQMPCGYGQLMAAAVTNYSELPENVIENREILIEVMQQHGFRVCPDHWWHFDFMGWQAFPQLDLSFQELEALNTVKSTLNIQ